MRAPILRPLILTLTAFAFLAAAGNDAMAQRGAPTLIRDAELEAAIRTISVPLFEAAGLDGNSVDTYIVRDDSLNAFVAGGQNVFLNTGLIMAADNVNQLVGVIAHETGHISGGHLARFQDGLKGASATSIMSMILGAAAIASGAGDAGMAILMGGQEAAQRQVLAYSRTQESAADQAGMQFLNATEQSGLGFVEFFEKLGEQELLYTTNRDPYVRSHPLTRDRINALRLQVDESPHRDSPNPEGYDDLFERIKAKLIGYFQPPHATFSKYPDSDQSLYARYARAYAHHQSRDLVKSVDEIRSLIREYPRDPFFWEALGFVLFENGRIEQSVEPYRRAVALAPREGLLRLQLGQALLATENRDVLEDAIAHLEEANRHDQGNPFTWRQLSTAYHQSGDEGMARLATAEYFALIGRMPEAHMQARAALKSLERGTPPWIKAEDLVGVTAQALGDRTPPVDDGDAAEQPAEPRSLGRDASNSRYQFMPPDVYRHRSHQH